MAPLRTFDALQHTWAHSPLLLFLVLYSFSLSQVSWRHEVSTGVRHATGSMTFNSTPEKTGLHLPSLCYLTPKEEV